ncbi:asparaginase [Uliginosibacterium sp. 31-16]|uniref:asparaginase n=1 Tax=Uliginosibacterium sp. 31-16 TaxID=3068315 RepID=UPI00273D230D|nr:asparaginase [Uliginosibacterium sp. 31-16]MDP5239401.1 asparaginase [Uliginosibacterium sp. 31-16]
MRLALIATGGTIAGTGAQDSYTAATLGAESLLGAVQELRRLADWHIEQPFALDSRDIEPAHWLQLAACIQGQIDDPAIDGIVVTHGTDTLEETAFALHLLLPAGKPVVLTAAMRPATSLSSDGPLNLLQAACVALSPAARNQGVLVVANDAVIAAHDLVKQHTHAVDALQSRAGRGLAGSVLGESVSMRLCTQAARTALLQAADGALPKPESLPRVDILYAHAGAAPDLIDACVTAGAAGIVLALSGHGSIPASWRAAIAKALSQGVHIVRASRVAAGGVRPQTNEDDAATGCIAAGDRTAQQARVLLLLALHCKQAERLGELFATL